MNEGALFVGVDKMILRTVLGFTVGLVDLTYQMLPRQ